MKRLIKVTDEELVDVLADTLAEEEAETLVNTD